MQQILYLIQKEFRQVFRDKTMMAIIFIAPFIQMVILGFAITVDVKNIETIIVDRDNSVMSREVSRKFENNPYFEVVAHMRGQTELQAFIDEWHAQMAVVIPPDFAKDLERRQQTAIQIIVDGLDGNTAGIALGYAQGLLSEHAISIINRTNADSGKQAVIIQPLVRMWYNLDLESKNYMVPGLIAVLLTLISMFLSSMALVREKELGTLEQLMVTPITTWQLIIGKVMPFLILAFAELAIMLAGAFLVFNLQVAGSITLLVALGALYLLTTLGLGIFISTLAQTQQQAMFISWFFMVFLIFMSGFLFPIENMPELARILTYIAPMRYFVIIVREIFIKGSGASSLLYEILALAVFAVTIIGLSAAKFSKRVR
jgi:ABC-2 type transport system permease protein